MFELSLDALYPSVQALGWALVHFCWQGALIAAVYAAGSLLLRQARPPMRYLFGLVSMAAMALAPILTFWLVYPGSVAMPMESGSIALLATPMAASSWQAASLADWLEGALPWVVLLWAVGVLLMSGRVFVNWRRMKRLTRVGVIRLADELQAEVEKLCRMFGIRQAVTVLESTIVTVPTVLGWLKPVILLPSSTLLGLSPGQLELVIAHELGHIRRLDYLVNLMQVAIETALFYHPAVGWISRHVRDEREKCVDDLVIGHCGNPIEYARALADLEGMRAGFQIAPAIGATDGQLLQRIERIVCDHTARPREAIAGNSILLLMLTAVVIVAGQIADPMADLDGYRNQLADTLIAELVIGPADQRSDRALVSLESARVLEQPVQNLPDEDLVIHQTVVVQTPAPSRQENDRQLVLPVSNPAPRTRTEPVEPIQKPVTAPSVMGQLELKRVPEQTETMATTAARTAVLEAAPQEPVRVQRNSQPGSVTRASPSYPVRARMAGQEGYVTVEFGIRENGRVTDVRVIDSSPRRVFDNEARKTMRKWRFDPDTLAGVGSKRFTQRFDFSLSGSTQADNFASKGCSPVTGTRICRAASPTSLVSQGT